MQPVKWPGPKPHGFSKNTQMTLKMLDKSYRLERPSKLREMTAEGWGGRGGLGGGGVEAGL